MTPDQLRELADRLEPMSAAPGFDGLDVPALAAWLRQCAEQRPAAYKHTEPNGHVSYFHTDESPCELCVPLYAHPAPAAPPHAMLDSHRRLVEQAIHTAEHPSGMSTHDGKARIDASVLRRMLAIIDSLTAAPQAEPCIGNDPTCPCQDGDACHYRDAADGTKGWPVPQAEPKREPLSDERIDEIGDPFGYFQYGDAQGDKRRAFARAIERAAYERAAQACEAQISGSDHHYLATHGHWDHMAQAATNCAAAIRALGRQHD